MTAIKIAASRFIPGLKPQGFHAPELFLGKRNAGIEWKRRFLAGVDRDLIWTEGDLKVRCVQVIDETADVKTFRFVAEPPVLFIYKPGQYVILKLEIDGKPVQRCYSISSTPSRSHTLEITVKRVLPTESTPNFPPGLVSNWLHDNITVGSEVKLSGPMGEFTCDASEGKKLLMISGGSGITPMMSCLRWICDTAPQHDIVFFHSARSPRDIIFWQELQLMAARHPNFRLAITITRPELGQAWAGFTGKLSEPMLQLIAPDFRERQVYVCGPDGFMQMVKTMLDGLDFPMQNYYFESFGPPKTSLKEPTPPPVPSSLPPIQKTVTFAKSGEEILTDGNESILEIAKRAGVNIASACEFGSCGTCKQLKLKGEVKYDPQNPAFFIKKFLSPGEILTCVAYPTEQVVMDT